jgi:hypothetical protein
VLSYLDVSALNSRLGPPAEADVIWQHVEDQRGNLRGIGGGDLIGGRAFRTDPNSDRPFPEGSRALLTELQSRRGFRTAVRTNHVTQPSRRAVTWRLSSRRYRSPR